MSIRGGVAGRVTQEVAEVRLETGIEDRFFIKGFGQATYADPSVIKHSHTSNHLQCFLEMESSRPVCWEL